jgi:hypothetical protein
MPCSQMLVAVTNGAVVAAPISGLGISGAELGCFLAFWAAQVCGHTGVPTPFCSTGCQSASAQGLQQQRACPSILLP